jgi:PAS domain S-box-containing protein
VAIAFFDTSGAITDANDAFLRMVGYTRAELRAGEVRWDRLTPPDRLPRTREAVDAYLRTGRIEPYEKEYFRRNGERFWGLFAGRRIDGTGEGMAFVLDITERKRAEAALRESEEKLRRAVSIETVGVLFFSLDGRILDANAAIQRMTGRSIEELRLVPDWRALTPPEFRAATERAFRELVAEGRTAPYEKQWIGKDGLRMWGLFAPTRVRGAGPDAECVEFVIDITRAKEASRNCVRRTDAKTSS